ncbi:Flagellar biosynthetic protein FliP [Buchnera aphidicola (Thelaxes suberi)]|uniref:flagellar type III secretion system pore protein FliP n=1 Tax=Buchnera aphidicola TaxID=9 RepID=UPI003464A590
MKYRYIPVILTVVIFFPFISHAASNIDIFNPIVKLIEENKSISSPLELLIFITSLSFISAVVLMMTSFTRIIIVFSLLRNAIGTPYAPPNQVLIGLALILTFFIMNPVIDKAYKLSYIPYSHEKINIVQALTNFTHPFKDFMLKQLTLSDINVFVKLDRKYKTPIKNYKNISMKFVLPAFIINEIKKGFQIGFTVLIPFLIVDLIVASVLMSLGMMMIPPSSISLPFKLFLFLVSNSWQLLIVSLFHSFFY